MKVCVRTARYVWVAARVAATIRRQIHLARTPRQADRPPEEPAGALHSMEARPPWNISTVTNMTSRRSDRSCTSVSAQERASMLESCSADVSVVRAPPAMPGICPPAEYARAGATAVHKITGDANQKPHSPGGESASTSVSRWTGFTRNANPSAVGSISAGHSPAHGAEPRGDQTAALAIVKPNPRTSTPSG